MAIFLSSPKTSRSRSTPGERRLAERLETFLEDDYLCWYDVAVGPEYQHPDFVILHPRRGILILEVKDWKLSTLREVTRNSFTVDFGAGHKSVPNPLEQARGYAHAVTKVLERDRQLLRGPESNYAGRLCFPYGFGVVLTGITRSQFEYHRLNEVMPSHLVVCQDEMIESVDPEGFQKRLWDMFTHPFHCLLTLPQVDRIRAHLFPELRISQSLLPLEPATSETSDGGITIREDLLQVMDLKQEITARGLGDGHRVIHGVAGSGKTLILAYRCQYLVRTTSGPILVLVYNTALAAWLQQQMVERGISDRVHVRNFHAWCRDQLRLYHVPQPADGADFHAETVAAVIRAVERGQIPRAQYGALLIDEAHDFEADWLKLAVQMLDPETNSLLLLYDDAQSIYGGRRSGGFSFRSVGIAAQGRTRILKRNYRNTDEILACATGFAREILEPEDADDDGVPLLRPESGGRKGSVPRFGQFRSLQSEAQGIVVEVQRLHRTGVPWRDIAVLYTAPFVGNALMDALQQAVIPVEWLKDSKSKRFNPGSDSVKLMTAHSSKGLQYRAVILAGAGFLPYRSEREDAKVMYVALTRATHELIITSSRKSLFSDRLDSLCQPLIPSRPLQEARQAG